MKSHIVAAKTVASIVKTSLVWSSTSEEMEQELMEETRVPVVWTRS